MLFIFSTPVLFRHLWLLKTVAFLHWCLICAVLLCNYKSSPEQPVSYRTMETISSYWVSDGYQYCLVWISNCFNSKTEDLQTDTLMQFLPPKFLTRLGCCKIKLTSQLMNYPFCYSHYSKMTKTGINFH